MSGVFFTHTSVPKERFDRDILMQNGVKKVIIFEGINDIGAARSGNSMKKMAGTQISILQNQVAETRAEAPEEIRAVTPEIRVEAPEITETTVETPPNGNTLTEPTTV